GLRGGANVLQLLARHPRLALLHGHLHRIFNHILATSSVVGAVLRKAEGNDATRLFGAPATCNGPDEHEEREVTPSFRLYEVDDGVVRGLDLPLPIQAA